MTESYIQNLFAERIGGRNYGQSTAIYKFEKIKRAKRAALAAHPGRKSLIWAWANRTKWPSRKSSPNSAGKRAAPKIAATRTTGTAC
jgi:hypothetical protein